MEKFPVDAIEMIRHHYETLPQKLKPIRERLGRPMTLAEKVLLADPFCGHLFVFRGRRGDLIKVIWYDGQGACLFSKRLETGRFVWPSPADGKVSVTPAQFAMLLEGIDWRTPQRTWRPDGGIIPSCRKFDSLRFF